MASVKSETVIRLIMASQSHSDLLMARIRNKLQQDQVKLWLPPYFVGETSMEEPLKELAFNYSDVIAAPFNDVVDVLRKLQTCALDKLASRTRFQATGVATLRLKIAGTKIVEEVAVSLDENGDALKRKILALMPQQSRIKMISNGIVLTEEKSLKEQKVANNSQILVLNLSSGDLQQAEEEIMKEVESVKKDAALLARNPDQSYLKITNQSGDAIELPPDEKESLAVAMALHEKGRVALKRNHVTLALTLFHEADQQFTSCRSELLAAVDNAGLLNLDIAWTYLLLGSATDIPDAARRLDRCQAVLNRSYGQHMERLLSLKGTTGNEAVLYLRLHLLQGVVAFHQGQILESSRLLNQAKEELSRLTIRDEDLTQLVALGYSVRECRLALRAVGGDLNEASWFLQRQRQRKEDERIRQREEDERNRIRRQLGKTAAGHWVNLGYLQTLEDMGFGRDRSVAVLKETDNDVSRAVELLQNGGMDTMGSADQFDQETLARIVSLGFPMELAQDILAQENGNLERTVERLTGSTSQQDQSDVPGSKSTDEPTGGDRGASPDVPGEKEAYQRLSQDFPNSDDYLDTNLEMETVFLNQYLSYLASS